VSEQPVDEPTLVEEVPETPAISVSIEEYEAARAALIDEGVEDPPDVDVVAAAVEAKVVDMLPE
jgi:hypothetical protein